MKVKVLQPFRDKEKFSRTFKPGEILDLDAERAENIVKLKLAERVAKADAKEAPKAGGKPRKNKK